MEDFHENFIRYSYINPFDPGIYNIEIHSVMSSIDLFKYSEDLIQQSDLKKKIKKTKLTTDDHFSLDSFKLYRDKMNKDLLIHLRLLLLNNDDIKHNRDIPSYIYDDFKDIVSDTNEHKCKMILKNLLHNNLEQNRTLKSRMDKTSCKMLEENSKLVNYLDDQRDQINLEELDNIISNNPMDVRTRNVLRNYYISILDDHLLQQNLINLGI